MRILLAGGYSGNLKPFWDEVMRIYLAGGYTREYVITEGMKIFLAGGNIGYKWAGDYDQAIQEYKPDILESYYYLQTHQNWFNNVRPFIGNFMLDSGAFTYLNQVTKEAPDWDAYIEKYADFINNNQVEHFLEMDIDPIVGIKGVEKLRDKLESLTNRQSIPVWHLSRGLDYWKDMIKNYDYVAIGGIVTKEIKPKQYPIFQKLIELAAQHNCKVHGLGFTRTKELRKYKFYSVDSTAWLYGNRGGFLYNFNGTELIKFEADGRLKGRPAALHNFIEWLKYQKYARQNL